jgi:hypothetical protein
MKLYFEYNPNQQVTLSKNGLWSYQVYETNVFYDEKMSLLAGTRVETKLIKDPKEKIAIRQNIFYLNEGTICLASSELNSPEIKIFEYPILYGTNKFLGAKGVGYASNLPHSTNVVIDIQFENNYVNWIMIVFFLFIIFCLLFIKFKKYK